MDEIFVQVRFKVSTQVGEYQGAIYFPYDEWQNVQQETIDNLKDQLITNWVDAILNAPPPVEPTQEQLKEELDRLEIAYVDARNIYEVKYPFTKEELEEEKTKLEERLSRVNMDISDRESKGRGR